jgi:hypothetical protein
MGVVRCMSLALVSLRNLVSLCRVDEIDARFSVGDDCKAESVLERQKGMRLRAVKIFAILVAAIRQWSWSVWFGCLSAPGISFLL